MMNPNGHIEFPLSDQCAFCDYLSGRRPYTVLHQDKLVAVLVTREQRGISHLLVLPVRHVETVLAISDEEASALMLRLRDAARAIDEAEHRPGISVWQNNGLPAHQKIPHVHFHIAGTLPDGGTDFGPVSEVPVAATNLIGDRLAPFVANWTPSRREAEPPV